MIWHSQHPEVRIKIVKDARPFRRGTGVMEKRVKASRTYRDSSDDDVEILGSTQGSSAPGILHSTASSRPAKRAMVASYMRRHRYNYRDTSHAEDED